MEPSCDPLGASWRHVGSCLEPSSAVLSHLGGHLGASEALLEPPWAILDALTPRAPLKETTWGRRGRVPLPGGKTVFGRKTTSSDHLRPEGWWDPTGRSYSKYPRPLLPASGTRLHSYAAAYIRHRAWGYTVALLDVVATWHRCETASVGGLRVVRVAVPLRGMYSACYATVLQHSLSAVREMQGSMAPCTR